VMTMIAQGGLHALIPLKGIEGWRYKELLFNQVIFDMIDELMNSRSIYEPPHSWDFMSTLMIMCTTPIFHVRIWNNCCTRSRFLNVWWPHSLIFDSICI
jgi:hypothetical protein